MGRKAVGPVCCVMHIKEPRTLIVKEKGLAPVFLDLRLEHPAGWICARYKSSVLLLWLLSIHLSLYIHLFTFNPSYVRSQNQYLTFLLVKLVKKYVKIKFTYTFTLTFSHTFMKQIAVLTVSLRPLSPVLKIKIHFCIHIKKIVHFHVLLFKV